MPKISKIEKQDDDILVTDQHKFAIEYKCECGRVIRYFDYERPEKIVKCFDCL